MLKTVIVVAVLCAPSVAAAADADWKFYGSAKSKQHCFYDADSVSFQTVGHPRVWTKCLNEDEVETAAAKDENLSKQAASKIVAGYVPPIASTPSDVSSRFLFTDQMISVVLYEQVADNAYVEPTVRIYWELNCSQGMIRALDISARNGMRGSPDTWSYIAPQTNASRLKKMVCRE